MKYFIIIVFLITQSNCSGYQLDYKNKPIRPNSNYPEDNYQPANFFRCSAHFSSPELQERCNNE